MMSSETSTDVSAFRPWHLFVLAGLIAATGAVVVVRPDSPEALVLLVAAVWAAAWVGFTFYRTLWPLASHEFHDRTEMVAGRARAALEREKTLVLRSIKELEFDRAMGKVSDEDFVEMGGRLRTRAIDLMRQLDADTPGYRERIERELARLLDEKIETPSPASPPRARLVCGNCETANERDAKFCKNCGRSLE
jgi:hypothetical protein